MMLRLERKRTCGFVSAGCMHIWQQDHVGDGVRGGRGLVAKPAAAGLPCWEVVSARQESGLGYRQRPLLFACPLHCVSSYPLAPGTLVTTLQCAPIDCRSAEPWKCRAYSCYCRKSDQCICLHDQCINVNMVLCRLFDLKSHNVLLTRDGTGKIADVGLAKVLTQVCSMPLPHLAIKRHDPSFLSMHLHPAAVPAVS